MLPEVAEMRKRSELVLKLAFKLFRDPRKREKVITILDKYMFAEISTHKALRMLRKLEEA